VSEQIEQAHRFLALHQGGSPLLLPNPWDVGSAKLLVALGFEALATTSSGYAATLGRLDGSVGREQTLAHAATIVDATELPVSADLENARRQPGIGRRGVRVRRDRSGRASGAGAARAGHLLVARGRGDRRGCGPIGIRIRRHRG
jgi:hypothetical protein